MGSGRWEVTFLDWRNRRFPVIRSVFYRRNWRAHYLLNCRVGRAKNRFGALVFLNLGIGLVGVFALPYGFQNARGIPFRKLDLLDDFGFGGTPLMGKVKEGSGRIKRICRLSTLGSAPLLSGYSHDD